MSDLPDANPKTRMGLAKPSYRYVPMVAVYEMGAVMANGAGKYGAFNWRADSITASTYIDATRRHLDALAEGQRIDPDSGKSHAAHIMANMAIFLDAAMCGKLNDDLPVESGPAPRYLAARTKVAS